MLGRGDPDPCWDSVVVAVLTPGVSNLIQVVVIFLAKGAFLQV